MNIFYFTERKYNTLEDYQFVKKYEHDVVQQNRNYLRFYLIIGLALSVFLTKEMIEATNIFLGILLMIPFTVFIEGYIFISFLKFTARLGMRYMNLMTGINQDINYDNVIN